MLLKDIGICMDRTEYNKKYQQENKERLNKRHREYYRENKERWLIYVPNYRKQNKERHNRINRLWRKNNPDKAKIMINNANHKRRALFNSVESTVTIEQLNKLIEDSKNICFWCNCDIGKGETHLDHIYPLSKGGGHTINNIVVSCATCNLRKKDKNPEVWLDEILSNKEYS